MTFKAPVQLWKPKTGQAQAAHSFLYPPPSLDPGEVGSPSWFLCGKGPLWGGLHMLSLPPSCVCGEAAGGCSFSDFLCDAETSMEERLK